MHDGQQRRRRVVALVVAIEVVERPHHVQLGLDQRAARSRARRSPTHCCASAAPLLAAAPAAAAALRRRARGARVISSSARSAFCSSADVPRRQHVRDRLPHQRRGRSCRAGAMRMPGSVGEHADARRSTRRSSARSRAWPSAPAAATRTTGDRTPARSSRVLRRRGRRRAGAACRRRRPRSSRSGDRQATPTPMPPPCDTRVNVSTFCGTPSSAISKSSAVRSVTGRPFRSRTTTSTRMAVVAAVKDCRLARSCRPGRPAGLPRSPTREQRNRRRQALVMMPLRSRRLNRRLAVIRSTRSIVERNTCSLPCFSATRQLVGSWGELIERQTSGLLNAAGRVGSRQRHRQLRDRLAVLQQLERRLRAPARLSPGMRRSRSRLPSPPCSRARPGSDRARRL